MRIVGILKWGPGASIRISSLPARIVSGLAGARSVPPLISPGHPTGNPMTPERNTGLPGSGAEKAGEQQSAPAVPPPGVKQTLRDMGRLIVELWWRFFDWLAVVPWKTLLV